MLFFLQRRQGEAARHASLAFILLAAAAAGCGGSSQMALSTPIDGAETVPVERSLFGGPVGQQRWVVGDFEIAKIVRSASRPSTCRARARCR